MIKRNAYRTILLSFAAIFLSASFLFAQIPQPNNTMVLTTYYPAPFGAYKKMTISDSVGIGTTGPGAGAKLHIKQGDTDFYDVDPTWTAVVIENSGNAFIDFDVPDSQSAGLRFDIGTNTMGAVIYDGPTSSYSEGLRFRAGNQDCMFIKSDGNVGIGTADPLGRLQVRGDATHPAAIFEVGNVGIGLQSPLSTLHIVPTGTGTLFEDGVRVQRDGTPSQYAILNQRGGSLNLVSVNTLGTGASTNFQRSDDGVFYKTSMVIDSTGNVGIGTTGPSQKLEIIGGQIRLLDVPWDEAFQTPRVSALVRDGAPGTLVNANSDYAFFGLEPVGPNRADALIEWGDDPAENGVPASWDSLKFVHMQWTTGTRHERMRIDPAGNVGIGTAEPQSALHVVGSYIQIPHSSGTPPPTSDCSSTAHAGRMHILGSSLYICPDNGSGWVIK